MNARTMISAAGALAVVAGAMAAPTAASAQSYYGNGYQGGSYNDPFCNNRGSATGVAVGAALGAAAGSSVAARGNRTEGAVLGGLLGAVVGAAVTRENSCDSNGYPRQSDGYGYQNSGYGSGYQSGYGSGYQSGYDYQGSGYGYQGYDRDNGYRGYDRGDRYDNRYGQRADYGQCRVTTVREGRYSRQVRMCMDRSGQYRIVD